MSCPSPNLEMHLGEILHVLKLTNSIPEMRQQEEVENAERAVRLMGASVLQTCTGL